MTSPSDNLLERFQSDRSEYFSPPICEILREYEAWRSEASNDLVGEMETKLEIAAAVFEDYARQHWDKAAEAADDTEQASRERKAQRNADYANEMRATLSRMRDARNGGGGR